MKFEVHIEREALRDLKLLRAFDRRAILDHAERILSATPRQESKSRIKRLRGVDSPMYRLRVGEFRVFYDVEDDQVYVTRVLAKADVAAFLKEMGYEAQDD